VADSLLQFLPMTCIGDVTHLGAPLHFFLSRPFMRPGQTDVLSLIRRLADWARLELRRPWSLSGVLTVLRRCSICYAARLWSLSQRCRILTGCWGSLFERNSNFKPVSRLRVAVIMSSWDRPGIENDRASIDSRQPFSEYRLTSLGCITVPTGPSNHFMLPVAWWRSSQSCSWNPAGSETLCLISAVVAVMAFL